ncbi:MAG: hypothetical protein J1E77_08820, partial [Prevotella sp.]|nr:hypothetical protein [Prevotella sp.]
CHRRALLAAAEKDTGRRASEIKTLKKSAERPILRIFLYLCTRINKKVTRKWTTTRRIITIREGGGWRARLLIPLPLRPFH